MEDVYEQEWKGGRKSLHLAISDCESFNAVVKQTYPDLEKPIGKPRIVSVDESVVVRLSETNGIFR